MRHAGPARTAEPAPAPPAAPAGRSLRFEATEGVPLRGTLIPGKRSRAPVVVLVHQSDGGPNEFEDFVPHLHAAGYGALTYESREDDRLDEVKSSRDVAGAVRALRRQPGVDPASGSLPRRSSTRRRATAGPGTCC